jgi:hypothetical protein
VAKIINTDDIVKTLLKISGERYPAGGFHGDWVDSQLYMAADKMCADIQAEARARVRRRKASGGYHDNIVIGDPYTYKGVRSIRVYAKRPGGAHANLIEYGWNVHSVDGNRKMPGKYVFDAGARGMEDKAADLFVKAAEKRLEDLVK